LQYLLDTHTLLWWLNNNQTLKESARQIISNSENAIFVSAVTAWEISIKKALGKSDAPNDLEDALKVNNFSHLPITIKDGLSIGALPLYHRDPFDRMLIAQALNRDLIIISRDSLFSQYQVKLILA
jgi:PIN domain nuclease of toxin-antitoxin system